MSNAFVREIVSRVGIVQEAKRERSAAAAVEVLLVGIVVGAVLVIAGRASEARRAWSAALESRRIGASRRPRWPFRYMPHLDAPAYAMERIRDAPSQSILLFLRITSSATRRYVGG
jgi:hypothetical protein